MSRTAEIRLTVDLDEQNVPAQILWEASEAKDSGPKSCRSMMLSLWDGERKTIAAIDLWVKEMTIDDMNLFFYQQIHQMADTYQRATQNTGLAKSIHEFGERFGGSAGLESNGSANGARQKKPLIDLVSLAEKNQSGSAE